MTTRKRRPLSRFFLGVGIVSVILFSSRADSQAAFYQGKTVTVIVSTSPAGTGDLRVKALMLNCKAYRGKKEDCDDIKESMRLVIS
jgi:hypothetical protein